jgi:hypothetical protein
MQIRKRQLMAGGAAVAAAGVVAVLAYSAVSQRGLVHQNVDAATAGALSASAHESVTSAARERHDRTAQADRSNQRAEADGAIHVDAPGTDVKVDKERGEVRVKAPYTNVHVDPDKGQVRVRAPYVDLNIRW